MIPEGGGRRAETSHQTDYDPQHDRTDNGLAVSTSTNGEGEGVEQPGQNTVQAQFLRDPAQLQDGMDEIAHQQI